MATTPSPSVADPRTLLIHAAFRSREPFPFFRKVFPLHLQSEASAGASPGKVGDGMKPRDPVSLRLTQEET